LQAGKHKNKYFEECKTKMNKKINVGSKKNVKEREVTKGKERAKENTIKKGGEG